MSLISFEVRDFLKKQYVSGETYKAMAKRYGLSYSYLRGIITGEYPAEGLTLATLEKISPQATISLSGGGCHEATGKNSATNIASPAAVAIAGDGDRLKDCRQAAIDEIINLDIPDDIRTKVLRILSKTLQ